jgi:hypothetical protein
LNSACRAADCPWSPDALRWPLTAKNSPAILAGRHRAPLSVRRSCQPELFNHRPRMGRLFKA